MKSSSNLVSLRFSVRARIGSELYGCYCLRITEVDPARNEVLFERFLSNERDEPPTSMSISSMKNVKRSFNGSIRRKEESTLPWHLL